MSIVRFLKEKVCKYCPHRIKMCCEDTVLNCDCFTVLYHLLYQEKITREDIEEISKKYLVPDFR